MPQDFWDWLGNSANTIVNGLLTAGQLLYGGLIAIGAFFVALGEAIGAWGMGLIGAYQGALGQSIKGRSRILRLSCLNQSVPPRLPHVRNGSDCLPVSPRYGGQAVSLPTS